MKPVLTIRSLIHTECS
ncbi:hypothetical protein NPIL_464111, partial [Nephila pilipes]